MKTLRILSAVFIAGCQWLSAQDYPYQNPFEEYSMQDRTYKFFEGEVLFPFGYGLSYTTFSIGKATLTDEQGNSGAFQISGTRDRNLKLTVPVKNTGKRTGDQVVQVYLRDLQDPDAALKQLCGFTRVTVPAGKTVIAEVPIMNQGLRTFDAQLQDMVVKPGRYELLYGCSSADKDLVKMQIELK